MTQTKICCEIWQNIIFSIHRFGLQFNIWKTLQQQIHGSKQAKKKSIFDLQTAMLNLKHIWKQGLTMYHLFFILHEFYVKMNLKLLINVLPCSLVFAHQFIKASRSSNDHLMSLPVIIFQNIRTLLFSSLIDLNSFWSIKWRELNSWARFSTLDFDTWQLLTLSFFICLKSTSTCGWCISTLCAPLWIPCDLSHVYPSAIITF